MTDRKDQLLADAEALGIDDLDRRHSEETIQDRIDEALAGIAPEHEPACSAETANARGEETESDNAAAQNTDPDPGPGSPDLRVIDPASLMDGDTQSGKRDEGRLPRAETPKIVHETVSAFSREITDNVIPDMAARAPLVRRAEEVGIHVDPSWEEKRIRAEIQMALEGRADLQVRGAVPPGKWGSLDYDAATAGQKTGVGIRLKKDFWDDDGKRVRANAVVTLDRDRAREMLDSGAAERIDPLP